MMEIPSKLSNGSPFSPHFTQKSSFSPITKFFDLKSSNQNSIYAATVKIPSDFWQLEFLIGCREAPIELWLILFGHSQKAFAPPTPYTQTSTVGHLISEKVPPNHLDKGWELPPLSGFQRSKCPLFKSQSNLNKQFTSDCSCWKFLLWIGFYNFCSIRSLSSFQRSKYPMF